MCGFDAFRKWALESGYREDLTIDRMEVIPRIIVDGYPKAFKHKEVYSVPILWWSIFNCQGMV